MAAPPRSNIPASKQDGQEDEETKVASPLVQAEPTFSKTESGIILASGCQVDDGQMTRNDGTFAMNEKGTQYYIPPLGRGLTAQPYKGFKKGDFVRCKTDGLIYLLVGFGYMKGDLSMRRLNTDYPFDPNKCEVVRRFQAGHYVWIGPNKYRIKKVLNIRKFKMLDLIFEDGDSECRMILNEFVYPF